VQLAIDGTQAAAISTTTGAAARALRDEGIMLLGSGNVVHNLRVMRGTNGAARIRGRCNSTRRCAIPFAQRARAARRLSLLGEPPRLSVPTPEHYLPMLYIAGARARRRVHVITDGIDLASVSMLSFADRASA
jgi:4,5-DOPA dioxygenase extradiol